LPPLRSHIFASILDDAKKIAGSCSASDGVGKQGIVLDEESSGLVASECSHQAMSGSLDAAAIASQHFSLAQEEKLTDRCRYLLLARNACENFATLATAVVTSVLFDLSASLWLEETITLLLASWLQNLRFTCQPFLKCADLELFPRGSVQK
jgi:hypothetical protein